MAPDKMHQAIAPEESSDGCFSSKASSVAESIDHLATPKKHKAIFVDAKSMKDKLRENMHKPKYDVTDFYWTAGICQKVARNNIFENLTLAVISFNALWLSIDTDANNAETLVDAHPVFIVVENFFCLYFTVELLFRFGAFKNKLNCFKDAWFVFDLFMVVMMVAETWIMSAFILIAGGGGSGGGMGNTGILRLLRLMRLSRMARMARLLRALPELLILIKGMVAATRAVCLTLLLLGLVLYVFGILFRQLSDGTDVGEAFFPGILSTMHNLVIVGIQHDGVADMLDAIEEEGQYALIPAYYFFVLVAAFTVLNMLIGVLCEVISAVANTEHEEIQIIHVREKLDEITKRQCTPNADGSLMIDKETFVKILTDEYCASLLADVKVDAFGLVDIVDTLFVTPEGQTKALQFSDLVEVILDQRSSNTAAKQDLTDLRKFVKGRLDTVELSINAKVLALGRILERNLGLRKGTYEESVARLQQAREAEKIMKSKQRLSCTSGKSVEPLCEPEVSGQEMQGKSRKGPQLIDTE